MNDNANPAATAASSRPCPRCRKECRPDESFCLHCDQDLSRPVSRRLREGQFSLAFLLGVMLFVSVWLAIYRALDEFVMVAAGLQSLAFFRTMWAAGVRRRHGGEMNGHQLVVTFLVSLASLVPTLVLAFVGMIVVGGAVGLVVLLFPFWADSEVATLIFACGYGGGALGGAIFAQWLMRPRE